MKGTLQNHLLGLKDEWDSALDYSADATKADAANKVLKLFAFF